MDIQDHEKKFRETFSEERLPLDTHALFQELAPHLPVKEKKRYLLWLLLLPAIAVGMLWYMTIEDDTDSEKEQITDIMQEVEVEAYDQVVAGSSPKRADLKRNRDYSSANDQNSDQMSQERNIMDDQSKNLLVSNEDKSTNEGLYAAAKATATDSQQLTENKHSVAARTSNDVELGNHLATPLAGLTAEPETSDVTMQSYLSGSQIAQNGEIAEFFETSSEAKSMEADENGEGTNIANRNTFDHQPLKIRNSVAAIQLDQQYDQGLFQATYPLSRTVPAISNIAFWAQASLTNNQWLIHSSSSEVDQLYAEIGSSRPSFQFQIGMNYSLPQNFTVRSSFFYRQLANALTHDFSTLSSVEDQGISEVFIDALGAKTNTTGTVEVIELHQYSGTWYQFLNQTGVQVELVYEMRLTPRSSIQPGIGITSTLWNQNKGSFLNSELIIQPIENNRFRWDPLVSWTPSLTYAYKVNSNLQFGFQLQYNNTKTEYSNQTIRYQVYNIGLTCTKKL